MQRIGRVARLQVQAERLKMSVGRGQRYDPGPLVSVPELALDGMGVVGRSAWGDDVPDVHHPAHPLSRFRGQNGISVGFTSHYTKMRERFGNHLTDGIAGENILIETNVVLHEAELQAGLVLETLDGRGVLLSEVQVATPCVPFTRYALHHPPEAAPDRTITESLQFLNGGMRGFYLALQGDPAVITVGTPVYLVSDDAPI
ncbi:MAG TPA: hypothetical protein VGR16_12645 [Thermomicrobiales bacterium]|nr:hypothetical protein [Thermomicrobiales bacterium]